MRHIVSIAVAATLSAGYAVAATPDSAKPAGAVTAAAAKEAVATLPLDQILARNAAARGGAEAWRRVKTLTLSGQIDAGKARPDGGRFAHWTRKLTKGEERAEALKAVYGQAEAKDTTIRLPFQIELKRPLLSRVEVQFAGDTALQVYDGHQGWKLRPFLGRHEVESFTPEESKAQAQQQELDGPLIDYAAKGTKVALDGSETIEGHPTYRLRLTLKDGAVRRVWIDAKTFLDTRIEGEPRRIDGRMRAVTTYFRDYQPADGLMVARTLETVVAGVRDSEKIHIDKVVVNAALDDSAFARPQ
jgi:outer membrane lipoprotein-sorting protein